MGINCLTELGKGKKKKKKRRIYNYEAHGSVSGEILKDRIPHP